MVIWWDFESKLQTERDAYSSGKSSGMGWKPHVVAEPDGGFWSKSDTYFEQAKVAM